MPEQQEPNPLDQLKVSEIRGYIRKYVSAHIPDLAMRRYETIIQGDKLIPYHFFLVGDSLDYSRVQAVSPEAYDSGSYHYKLSAPIIKHYGQHDSIKVRIHDLTANELNMEMAIAIDQSGGPVEWKMEVQYVEGLGKQIVNDIT